MNLPSPPPPTWTTGTTLGLKTGTWRAALPVYRNPPSPCLAACPINGRIAEWMQHAADGSWRAAWETLTDHNPFPAVAGRVCHHPCESACNRGAYDSPLAICALERHVGDLALQEGWAFPSPPLGNERVAVVGAGPSGLSAAYQLRRRGYGVTLFEARDFLGGLLREGIPPYRLPRKVLDAEIARILALGIDVHTGTALSSVQQLAGLRSEFDAVYLALGARRQKRLPALDTGAPWVMDGAEYLAQVNSGGAPKLGRRLAVIGGGSAAMDVARSARRAGHEVTVLSLESEPQLPAQRGEVLEAKEEGIRILAGTMLRAARQEADEVRLECVRVEFTAGERRGEFQVTPLAQSEFRVQTDAVVVAIGQDPELAMLHGMLAREGPLVKVDALGATSVEGVFAGGDVASGERFVTHAIGMGRSAALAIDRWIQGEAGRPLAPLPSVPASAINTFYHPHAPRVALSRLSPFERLRGQAEVQLGIGTDGALSEAARCFSCGRCTSCDNCLTYCPDMAVERAPGGYAIVGDYCKGCGLCVQECPTGSIAMQDERR